ncbi:efflux RND transporter periplasmic adaptor subunit [Thiohalobacter sp.]|uniref:efflux RND transporter periplasmic adaptor subunit n=1 Tax=Thiohalobacter sp. TaxID=2025948 RepID=UPI002615A80B|nr:efflux RND transporter periplasmic adaptor subunit [Thiohalobacter sp.]
MRQASMKWIVAWTWWLLAGPALAERWSGRLAWVDITRLSTGVSGMVVAVSARPGDRVAEGQSLLKLDQSAFRARLAAAGAEIEKAAAERDEARRELDRARELFERTLLSVRELQLAEIGLARAEAALRAARARKAAAEFDLRYSEIRAPFAGRVVARDVMPGERVSVEECPRPLLILARGDRMAVRFAPGDAVPAVGDSLRVTAGGASWTARLVRIETGADGEPLAVAEFETDRPLQAGLPVEVRRP